MILNEKQKKFCNEYLIDLNATQAAIRAGYSKNTANEQASRLLANVNIQEYIAQLQEGIRKRYQIEQDEVIRDLIEVKNRCMQNVPVMRYDKETKEWKHERLEDGKLVYKFDAQGAIKALDLLAKHIGFYEKDNKQKSVVPIIIDNIE